MSTSEKDNLGLSSDAKNVSEQEAQKKHKEQEKVEQTKREKKLRRQKTRRNILIVILIIIIILLLLRSCAPMRELVSNIAPLGTLIDQNIGDITEDIKNLNYVLIYGH